MHYWQYRAFDKDLTTHTGVAKSRTKDLNALTVIGASLRQRGLQLTELTTISHEKYASEIRLAKWKKKLNPAPIIQEAPQTKSIRRRVREFIASLFTGRNT